MSFRDALNKQKLPISIAAAIMLVVCGWFIVSNLTDNSQVLGSKQFFTNDDGKTFFIDSVQKVPPFEHEGKTAYIAQLFRCPQGGEPFVGYLERYAPEGQEILRKYYAQPDRAKAAGLLFPVLNHTEIKRPGATQWSRSNDFEANAAVTDIFCPQHPGERAVRVDPDE